MKTDKQWQDTKEDYLCRVEAALRMTDNESRQNILKDVEEHLDRRYAELTADCQNHEHYMAIIADMGPAEDYAELLASKTPLHGPEDTSPKKPVFLNRLMIVLLILALLSAAGWKIITGLVLDHGRQPLAPFENDPQLVGQWVAVDFVQHPDAFTPEHRQWPGNLYLKAMVFYDNGTTAGPWEWTKGDIYHPGDKSHAKYLFRQVSGETYLFFAWMNGDVLNRGEKPSYYVFKKGDATELLQTQFQRKLPPFENDPQLVGQWVAVDFVQHPDVFTPQHRQWPGNLYLKAMAFYDNGTTAGPWQWTKGDIYHPGDKSHAKYLFRQVSGETYLFFAWMNGDVLNRGAKPSYYVFKKGDATELLRTQFQRKLPPFENDPQLVGKWVSVDFVEHPDAFVPGQKQWKGDLYLKTMTFYDNGKTAGPWEWTKGDIYHPGDDSHAKYQIRQIDGQDYLCFAWMNGDVLFRGESPCYYVLKREK
jgi:hypothetical protein